MAARPARNLERDHAMSGAHRLNYDAAMRGAKDKRRKSGPVVVTKVPVVKCALCKRPFPVRPGTTPSKVLTAHWQEAHS